jgi:hypothetical protein
MVKLHIKRGDESQFLYETTVDKPVNEIIKEVTVIYNGRLKIRRICDGKLIYMFLLLLVLCLLKILGSHCGEDSLLGYHLQVSLISYDVGYVCVKFVQIVVLLLYLCFLIRYIPRVSPPYSHNVVLEGN